MAFTSYLVHWLKQQYTRINKISFVLFSNWLHVCISTLHLSHQFYHCPLSVDQELFVTFTSHIIHCKTIVEPILKPRETKNSDRASIKARKLCHVTAQSRDSHTYPQTSSTSNNTTGNSLTTYTLWLIYELVVVPQPVTTTITSRSNFHVASRYYFLS